VRSRLLCLSTLLAVLLPASARVLGHHAFAAQYLTTEDTWTGTVTRIDWRSPHIHIYLDIADKTGKVTNWMYEFPSPEQVIRRGLTRTFIKIGDKLTIIGYPAKASQPVGMVHKVAGGDGKLIFVSNYEDFGPTKSDGPVVTPTGEPTAP
jgi:hypothetical protein